jgi:hypothetical protein
MILRKTVVISILVVLGISCAGAVMALYNSVTASAQIYPEALNNIPSDYQFVFGVNVQQATKSPMFAQLQQNGGMGRDLQSFIEKTGLDPQRDISYLVGAGRSGESARNQGVMIAIGQFDKNRITSYIRAKSTVVEKEYGGSSVLMIQNTKSDTAPEMGIAFLNGQKMAMGDLESLKTVLDLGGREDRSILSSETVGPLIRCINPDTMFWFAGNAGTILSKAPAQLPLAQSASSIKSFIGTLNISDAVTGKITAIAIDAPSAIKLADGIKGLIALGQLTGNQNPDLKALLGGLAVSQNSTEVTLAVNFPPELLQRLRQSGKITQPTFR